MSTAAAWSWMRSADDPVGGTVVRQQLAAVQLDRRAAAPPRPRRRRRCPVGARASATARVEAMDVALDPPSRVEQVDVALAANQVR